MTYETRQRAYGICGLLFMVAYGFLLRIMVTHGEYVRYSDSGFFDGVVWVAGISCVFCVGALLGKEQFFVPGGGTLVFLLLCAIPGPHLTKDLLRYFVSWSPAPLLVSIIMLVVLWVVASFCLRRA